MMSLMSLVLSSSGTKKDTADCAKCVPLHIHTYVTFTVHFDLLYVRNFH